MTALNPSTQIPASVDTLEKLAVWALYVLQDLNFDTTLVEQTNGQPIPVATITPFNVRSSDFSGIRAIGRFSIPVSGDFAADSRAWVGVEELSTTAIPAAYTS